MLRKNSFIVVVILVGCVTTTPLTHAGEAVQIAARTQETTFRLNDICRQSPATVAYRDINELRNTAATQGFNVVQVIFADAYSSNGRARLWLCPGNFR